MPHAAKNHICAALFLPAAFIAQYACGETTIATNSIDISAFYREWAISPSNVLEKISAAVDGACHCV
jgi:hypothetical protein